MLSAGDRREGAQRFLAACESAAPAAAPALGSLAQRLVRELGTPAVVAMADRVAVATAMVLVYDRGSPGAAPVVELRGHAGPIRDLAISGDGWLASASADGSARLWELAAPGAGAALPTGAGTPVQVAFLADGRLLTRVAPPPADAQVVDLKHTVRIWTRDLDALLGAACAVAGRNLGLDEWERLFPGAAYRPTCP